MTALFQRPIDAHQHSLRVGAALAAIAVAVFADDHRRPDGSFGRVVVEGNRGIVEKRQEVVAVTAETLQQPLRLLVLPGVLVPRETECTTG